MRPKGSKFKSNNPAHKALVKAIEILGGQKLFAEKLGLSQPYINRWLKKGVGVPIWHVLSVEKAVNYKVTKEQLRPDYYK